MPDRVSAQSKEVPDAQMSAVGLLMYALLAVVLLPLLPLLGAVWAVGWLTRERTRPAVE